MGDVLAGRDPDVAGHDLSRGHQGWPEGWPQVTAHVFVGEQSGPCGYLWPGAEPGDECNQPLNNAVHVTETELRRSLESTAVMDAPAEDGGPGPGTWSANVRLMDRWQISMGQSDREIKDGPYPVRRWVLDHPGSREPVLVAWRGLLDLGIAMCLVTYWHGGKLYAQMTWGELFGLSVEDLGKWARGDDPWS